MYQRRLAAWDLGKSAVPFLEKDKIDLRQDAEGFLQIELHGLGLVQARARNSCGLPRARLFIKRWREFLAQPKEDEERNSQQHDGAGGSRVAGA